MKFVEKGANSVCTDWAGGRLVADYDFLLIGAGILGLSTARELQQRNPGSRVCVVE